MQRFLGVLLTFFLLCAAGCSNPLSSLLGSFDKDKPADSAAPVQTADATGSDTDFHEITEPGYYAELMMQANHVFYVRRKISDSAAMGAGTIFRADVNSAGKPERITALTGGSIVMADAGFGPFATITFAYDGKGRVAQIAFFGATGDPVDINFSPDVRGCKFDYAYPAGENPQITVTQAVTPTPVYQQQAPPPAPPQESTPPPAVANGQIVGTEVRIRTGPGTNYDILGHFANGEYVSIQQTVEGWYCVQRASGTVGWVSAQFCRRL